jgi:WD40 repeat protein
MLVAVAIVIGVAPAAAQRDDASYRPGDRVEVNAGGGWKPGTVVEAPGDSRWVEVRLDVSDIPPLSSMPGMEGRLSEEARLRMEEARELMRASRYPVEYVRALESAPTTDPTPTGAWRTWTDRSGQFSVDARFVSVDDDKVVLVNTENKRLEISLDRLCDADVRYVKQLRQSSENPFQEVPSPRRGGSSAPGASPRKGDWHSAKTIRPREFSKWTFVPEGQGESAVQALANMRNAEVELKDLPDSDKFFEEVSGLYVSADGHWGVVGRVQGVVASEKDTYLEVVDLQRGRSRGLTPLAGEIALLDVLPSEALVMYRPDVFGSGKNSALMIARLKNDQLVPVAQWEPYSDADWEPSRDIEKAWFLGPDRVLTVNQHGQALTVWDIGSAKALVNVPVKTSMDDKCALSSDRRYLAIIMDDGIAIIDLQDDEHVATLPTEGDTIRRIAFRDDNRQLAGVSDMGLSVWDLTTGDKVVEFNPSSLNYGDELAWAGKYVLVRNQHLFDTERRILLWEYLGSLGGGTESATLRGGRMWIVPNLERNRQATLVSVAIPHAAARREASRLPSAEELLVVRPGDEVSIETDIATGAISADEVRQSLTTALEDAGLHVVDNAPLVLKAVCKPQEQQTVRINTDMRLPVREKDIVERTITPHASQLTMALDGETVWKRGYIARPGHIFFLEKGENLDQALDRLTKPNPSLFTAFKFNGYVARPGKASEAGAYGVSRLTAGGVVDGGSTRRQGTF